MRCPFTKIDAAWTCPQCGYVHPVRSEKRPVRSCPRSPDLQPAADKLGVTLADIAHWFGAVTRWVKEGMPERTAAEVAACFAMCQTCNALVGDRCSDCRCRVAIEGMAIRNKAAMRTEVCPRGRWEA